MPNWCVNKIRVTSEYPEEIDRFLQFIRSDDEEFDFNNIIPYPEEYKILDDIANEWKNNNQEEDWSKRPKDGFDRDRLDWYVDNWGPKSNPGYVEIQRKSDKEVLIIIDTAWSPPIPIINILIDNYPEIDISMRYSEHGTGISGFISSYKTWEKGNCIIRKNSFKKDFYTKYLIFQRIRDRRNDIIRRENNDMRE